MNLDFQGAERPRRIAVLEPAHRVREVVARAIRRLGHMPEAFADAREMTAASDAASQGHVAHYDQVWVGCSHDLGATGDLLAAVRAVVGPEVPMILSAPRMGRTALALRHARSIDAVVTPQSPVALYGELRGIFVRCGFGAAASEMRCGPYRFDPATSHVRIGDDRIELRPLEFDLALEFFRHADRSLAREWLYAMVWNDAVVDSRALDTHVSRLRRKLRMPTADGWTLIAVSRVGYRLVVPAADGATARAASTSFASEAGLSSGA